MAADYTPAIGFGGKLELDTAYPSTPSLVEVGHVRDFGYQINVGEEDVTHQQSSGAAQPFWAEWIPGKVDCTITFDVNYDPGDENHDDTLNDEIGIVRSWTYTFKDGSTLSFPGFYTGIGVSVPNETRNAGDVSIRVTGPPTFVPHTP